MFERLLSWLKGYEDQMENGSTPYQPFITRTRITREQFERIVTLRKDGWTYPAIAKVTGLSERTCSNVYNHRNDYDEVIAARDFDNV